MKKLLSIILAAAMILSLVPSVFAEGETVYTYNFNSKATSNQGVAVGPILNYSEYSDDDGRNWKYSDMSDGIETRYNAASNDTAKRKVAGFDSNALVVKFASDGEWLALKLRVPEKGIYKISTKIYQHKSSRLPRGYMSIFPETFDGEFTYNTNGTSGVLNSGKTLSTSISFEDTSLSEATDYVYDFSKVITVNSDNDEFIYVIGNVSNNTGSAYIRNLTFTKVTDTVTFGDVDAVSLEEGNSQKVAASLDTYTRLTGASGILYTIDDTSVATVSGNGTVTAVGEGETTLTARIGDATASIPVTVTAPEEDKQFTNEFTGENGYTEDETKAFTAPEEGAATTTVNTYTTVIGGTNSTATPNTVNLGEEFSITANEKDDDGNVFLYWVLGLSENKKVLTRDRTLKFMPTVETKHVIAVYEPENGATVSGESFYNANGQLLTYVAITDDGKMPPLPSMTGYGTASAWVQYGTNEEFAENADAPTENLMFIAKYGEPTTTFAIDVVDGSGSGNYTYGKEVTCTATVPDGKVFKCWTKTPEGSETTKIISLDSTYTFNAWESCTITAVFADEEPVFTGNKFSIILSTMGTVDNNTAYMAEFVGLGGAVEKGIMFGNKRVAMTTDAAQFTVVNDTGATDVTGYAILSDGTVIYDK